MVERRISASALGAEVKVLCRLVAGLGLGLSTSEMCDRVDGAWELGNRSCSGRYDTDTADMRRAATGSSDPALRRSEGAGWSIRLMPR